MTVRGRTPWAVVLLKFTDVGLPSDSADRFRRQFTTVGAGSGNHLDYWRDMSYGVLDLTGSEVFGWWTMQYSLARDAGLGRRGWTAEARRLLEANNVDLNRFHGVAAIVNAHVDGSSAGLDWAGSYEGAWGETGWRYCRLCFGLAHSADGRASGVCPGRVSGGAHDYSQSGAYALATASDFPGEAGWRRCTRCSLLVSAPNPASPPGPCPASGSHAVDTAREYRLRTGTLPWGDQSGWRRCSRCRILAYMGDTPTVRAGCAAGGNHDFGSSSAYGVHMPLQDVDMYFSAHETGHGYRLGHAGRRGDTDVYADRWDVMGYGRAYRHEEYGEAGCGLSAATRGILGWIPAGRIARFEVAPGRSERIRIVPLDDPSAAGSLVAHAITGSALYTVELRRSRGWDRAFPRDGAVLIHELASSYLAIQRNWRFCNRCRSMAFAGRLACAGGGIHDVSRSGSYFLRREGQPGAVGQLGWRYCGKCQGLVFAPDGNPRTPCAYGGTHNVQASGPYVVATEDDVGIEGQRRWRYCFKCGSLAYERAAGRSACPAGGVHDSSRSGRYLVPHGSADEHAQGGWRWCAKCQGLVFVGRGFGAGWCSGHGELGHDFSTSGDYGVAPDRAPFDGQGNWQWCSRCNVLAFGDAPRPCAAGGQHAFQASGGYRVPHGPTLSGGQTGWRFCSRCGGLVFPEGGNTGPCPAEGSHDVSLSGAYVAADPGVVRLVPADATRDDWRAGDAFTDPMRRLRVTIESASTTDAVLVMTGM